MKPRNSSTNNPVHVVHVIPTLRFGGAERFVVDLTRHVPQKLATQSVITLWDDRPLLSELPKSVECSVIPFDKTVYTRRISVMKKKFLDLQAEVIHTHLFSADLWARIAAHQLGIPVVTTEHNINVGESGLWKFIKRNMRNYSRVYTSPSQAVGKFMEEAYHISPLNIRVIPHGIDLKKFTSIKPAKFKPPYKIGLIGRIVEQKGHRVALDALRELVGVPCKLIMVGEGNLKEELMSYAKKIGVSDRVEWRPPTHAVEKIYQELDMVLVPSLWEGLGLVILEAEASERLVIASDVDGIPEIVNPGDTGLLVPPKNSHALAIAIRESLHDISGSQEVAARARAYAIEHADIATMAREYGELYQEIAKPF